MKKPNIKLFTSHFSLLTHQKGFTLIEVLIVVSIIGLLASIVLVGLGGFRARGADARRIVDLRQVQNALELYYQKNGNYPSLPGCPAGGYSSRSCWNDLAGALRDAGIGVPRIPNDPDATASYDYGTDGQTYTLGAKLKGRDPAFNDDVDGLSNGLDCTAGLPEETAYCVSF